jgi:hypothetical protein
LSRGIRHAIFLTRSDRTRLLSLTGHPSCRAILFFGFGADHIEDEITARLRNAKDALDRRMSFVLRRRRMIGRLFDKGLYALIKLNRRKVRISAKWLPRPQTKRGRQTPLSGKP